MKNILLFIISIFIVQSAVAQKVDWNKPLYTISVSCTRGMYTEEDFKRVDNWLKNSKEGEDIPFDISFPLHFTIFDTIGTYTYSGDTMIYKDKFGIKKTYLGDKIIEEKDSNRHYIYQYDYHGSLSTKIFISYLSNQIAYEHSDTISYKNKYDRKNRLIKIKGTDKKKFFFKYRGNKKIENSHSPKDRYHRIYYYKDSNYQNDTLRITYRPRNCQYKRTEYDSLNRPIQIDYWADSGMFSEKGFNYTTYSYIDNIKICVDFDIDCIYTSGTIYKKEEE